MPCMWRPEGQPESVLFLLHVDYALVLQRDLHPLHAVSRFLLLHIFSVSHSLCLRSILKCPPTFVLLCIVVFDVTWEVLCLLVAPLLYALLVRLHPSLTSVLVIRHLHWFSTLTAPCRLEILKPLRSGTHAQKQT